MINIDHDVAGWKEEGHGCEEGLVLALWFC